MDAGGDNGCFATIRLRCCMLEGDTIAVQATLARSAARDLEPRCQRPWGSCGRTGRAACAEGSLPGVWAADSWLPRGNKRRCSRLAPRGGGLLSPGCSAARGLPGGQQGRRPQHLYTTPFAKRKPCMARAWHANVLGQTTVAWALLAGTARLSDGRCDFVARVSPRVWWLPQQKQLTGLRRL